MNNNDNNLNNNQSSNSDLEQFATMFSATIKESSAQPAPSVSNNNSNMDTNNSVNQTQNVTGMNTIPSTPMQQDVISNPTETVISNTSSTAISTPPKTPHVQQYGVGNSGVVGVRNPILNDDLLVAFIGDNYQKFANNIFNWSAFFFGASYFFYRKLYLVGFIVLILTNIFTNSFLGILVLGVVEGIVFYPIYRSWAMQKVDTIRTEKASLSHEEQRSICIQTGGTSIPSIFICFGINIVISLLSFLISLIPIFS